MVWQTGHCVDCVVATEECKRMAHVSSHVELRIDAFPHLAEHVECQCQEHVDVKGSESTQTLSEPSIRLTFFL